MSPELKGDQKNPSLITLFLKRLSRAIFFKGTHVSRSFPAEINHFTGFSVICMKGKSWRAHKATSIAGHISLTKTPSKRIELGRVSGPAVGGYDERGAPLVVASQRGPGSPKHHCKEVGGGDKKKIKLDVQRHRWERKRNRGLVKGLWQSQRSFQPAVADDALLGARGGDAGQQLAKQAPR